MEGTKALLVEAAVETAVRWPEGETPPGRKSRRRSASGRVHGLKALVRGMQRGAKLPPCQDEAKPVASGVPRRGMTDAHLASSIATTSSSLFTLRVKHARSTWSWR